MPPKKNYFFITINGSKFLSPDYPAKKWKKTVESLSKINYFDLSDKKVKEINDEFFKNLKWLPRPDRSFLIEEEVKEVDEPKPK